MQTLKERFEQINDNNRNLENGGKNFKKGFVFFHRELGKPMYMEIDSTSFTVDLKLYDLAYPKASRREYGKTLLEMIKNDMIETSDEIMVGDELVASLGSSYFKKKNGGYFPFVENYACINNVNVYDPKMRRKGLGTFLRRTAEEIYSANEFDKLHATKNQNLRQEDYDVPFWKYKFCKDAYLKFLAANGFLVCKETYQLPCKRKISTKGILNPDLRELDKHIGNDNYFQIMDESLSFDDLCSAQEFAD